MTVAINTSILAHIALDSELNGRFGVQGNTFANTCGYLNQYLNTQPDTSPQIKSLAKGMKGMVQREKYLDDLHCNTQVYNYFEWFADKINLQKFIPQFIYAFFQKICHFIGALFFKTVNHFSKKTAKEVNALKLNESLLLPGGWIGSPGHAMVYQFQKSPEDELIFSIYNSGAGINHHQKTSSTEKELYSPVKSFKLPNPLDNKNLKALIETLIKPMLPLNDVNNPDNADKLYSEIERSLTFLNAKPLIQELHRAQAVTGSQLSGTCAQRSLHQMLKLNFETLVEYQRFIFKFKMHALADFINTHPAPRSKQITDLIEKAVTNNLKILQEENAFNDSEKESAFNELNVISVQLLSAELLKESECWFSLNEFSALVNRFTCWFSSSSLAQSITSFNASQSKFVSANDMPLKSIEADSFQDDLKEVITRCKLQKEKYPLWVINQIEEAILQLPMPKEVKTRPSAYAKIDFYHQVQTTEQVETINSQIDELYDLYTKASQDYLGEAIIPTQVITHCSFIALRGYFAFEQAKLTKTPSFHLYFQSSLDIYLKNFTRNTFLACEEPRFDKRLIDLRQLHINWRERVHLSPMNDYQLIIDSEPQLKRKLEIVHEKSWYKSFKHPSKNALYVALSSFDEENNLKFFSTLNSKEFKPLLLKMRQRFLFEKAYKQYLSPLLAKTSPRAHKRFKDGSTRHRPVSYLKLPLSEITELAHLERYLTSKLCKTYDIASLTHTSSLNKHKYDIKISPAQLALYDTSFKAMDDVSIFSSPYDFGEQDPYRHLNIYSDHASNSIQLKPYHALPNNLMDSREYFNRDLFHLRGSPSHQIKLTIDYFSRLKAMLHLAKRSVQQYVEANIFEAPLLIQELDNNDQFISQVNNFIEKGLSAHKAADGQLSQASLFFIKLKLDIYRYAALNNPSQAFVESYGAEYERILQLINHQSEPHILASLHAFKFYHAMSLHPLLANDETRLIEDALVSYFHYKSNSNPYFKEDTATTFEMSRMSIYFKVCLKRLEMPKIKQLMSTLFSQLNISLEGLVLDANYPSFSYKNKAGESVYTLNIEQGKLYHNHYSLSSTPLNIRNHPVIETFGLHDSGACWMSEDESMLLLKEANVRLKWQGKKLAIQKQWPLESGELAWFELRMLSHRQKQFFNLEANDVLSNTLPEILKDTTIQAWSNKKQTLLVQNNLPVYLIDSYGYIHQLDSKGKKNGCLLSALPEAKQKLLAKFERLDFIKVNLDKNNCGTVDFSRYDFSLQVVNHQLFLPDTNYELVDVSSLDKKIASLTFTDGSDKLCILPVQRFYLDASQRQITGEYYHLTHDTADHISITQRCLELDKTREVELPLINRHQTNSAITFEVDDKGALKPQCAADALYLIYCYLATHQTQNALNLLNNINRHFPLQDTEAEKLHLNWIINDLPTVLDPNTDIDSKLETPEYVVCQLKALALYASYCHVNGNDKNTLAKDSEELKTFIDELPKTINKLFVTFLRAKRHLDEKFILADHESLSLLNYCGQHSEDEQYLGAIGYEKRRLNLALLMNEFKQLEEQFKASDTLPLDFRNRFNELKAEAEKQIDIMKRSSQLEWIEIDLKLYAHVKGITGKTLADDDRIEIPEDFNREDITDSDKAIMALWKKEGVFSNSKACSVAMDSLTPNISTSDFIYYFSTYLTIACKGAESDKQYLGDYCRHYLIGAKQAKKNQSHAKNKTLVNILYRVLQNAEDFDVKEKLTFKQLIKKSAALTISPLRVSRPLDVFEELLISSQDIWRTLESEKLLPKALPALKALYPKPLWQCLEMGDACQTYLDIETKYARQMALIDTEDAAGFEKFNCLTLQNKEANDTFSQPEVLSQLQTNTALLEAKQALEIESVWQQITNKMNAAPKDKIKLLAKQTHLLSQSDLLTLYLSGDLTAFMQETLLDERECVALYQLLHHFVSLSVQHQQVQRVLAAIEQSEPQVIAKALMSENMPLAQINPALMLFQFKENLLIRPRQVEALTSLLSTSADVYHYMNVVEKVIMGGGKSKVILPLLAAKKATGLNLVIIEVPRPLLETNHNDLNETSQSHFNQRAHKFEFNRDSDCSAQRLENLYQSFTVMMTNKEYLVTTGESMQSLELKYLELLLSGPELTDSKEAWQQQVYWLSKIIGLIKNRGDVIIDEVHQGLLLKKKLNYTLGSTTAISAELIKQSIALYVFIDALADEGKQYSIDNLLFDLNSPLRAVMQQLKAGNEALDIERIVEDYLSDSALDKVITKAPVEIKDCLAFYKEQLTLLPLTQARHYKEHYGPSHSQLTALARALAIPYLASNQPNERSRFGNILETLNYTIQSLLHEGLNVDILKESIKGWQKQAHQELNLAMTPQLTFNETETAQRVNQLFEGSGFQLSSFNFRSDKCDELIDQLLETVKFSKKFIYDVLQDKILSQIMLDQSVLHSDSYNHADLYRSVQGVSGTPDNHDYYHQKIHYNPKTSLGTDGYIKTILKTKNTCVTPVALHNSSDFIKTLFELNSETKALIDVSATFAGISNHDVVLQILNHSTLLNNEIKFILYFNAADVLCALDTNSRKIIKLNSSDPDVINKKLKCTPESRFTYYDQSHTVGTDLKQSSQAHALVLADARTQSQSFLQGAMRMRSLEEAQTISIIVPENTPATLDELFDLMDRNQQRQLNEDCFFAALAQMNNSIRQDFLSKIAQLPHADADKQRQLALSFKHYFLEIKPRSLFDECGDIRIDHFVSDLLKRLKSKLLQDWFTYLTAVDSKPNQKDKASMSQLLDDIVSRSIPLCNEKVKSKSLKDNALGMAVEHETMKENEKEVLKEAINFDPMLQPHYGMPWHGDHFPTKENPSHKGKNFDFMYSLKGKTDAASPFSDSLYVHNNFSKVYTTQVNMVGPYLKPVMAILFFMKNATLSACLVDQDDLKSISNVIKGINLSEEVWISTAQHKVLEGVMPADMLENKVYLSLIEQINFFNGDFDLILSQKTPLHWLNRNTDEKLDFFEKKLMSYRQTSKAEFNNVKKHMAHCLAASTLNASAGFFHNKPAEDDTPDNVPRLT